MQVHTGGLYPLFPVMYDLADEKTSVDALTRTAKEANDTVHHIHKLDSRLKRFKEVEAMSY